MRRLLQSIPAGRAVLQCADAAWDKTWPYIALCMLIAAGAWIVYNAYVGYRNQVAADARAHEASVQTAIIKRERPQMGAIEVRFWQAAIATAARKHGIDPAIATAKVAQESTFYQHLVSKKGARCASQIMPFNAKPDEVGEIESCLDKGMAILAKYVKECGDVYAGLLCYYAGPGNAKNPRHRHYADAILARVLLARDEVARAGG